MSPNGYSFGKEYKFMFVLLLKKLNDTVSMCCLADVADPEARRSKRDG